MHAASLSPAAQAQLSTDCHLHIFTGHAVVAGARYQPHYEAKLSDWLMLAGACGIRRGILVQPSFLGADNRHMLSALAEHPDRLRGVAVVPSTARNAEFADLKLRGVCGIRLNLHGVANDLALVRELPAAWWDALLAEGLHLELHASIGRAGALLPALPQGVSVVLDHFGKPSTPFPDDGVFRAASVRTGDVYVTLSGGYRQHPDVQSALPAVAKCWLDAVGVERLLWASDWPHTNHEAEADYAAARSALDLFLGDAALQRAALSANPTRLYWRE